MNDADEEQMSWPVTVDVPYDELAHKITVFCHELNRREQESRGRSLEAALAIWPTLRAALLAKGRGLGLNNLAEPKLPQWANQPVVPIEGETMAPKRRSKKEAMRIALTVGDGSWATIGELWLWVGGGGPIVDRTLQKYGHLPGEPKYGCKD